MPNRNRFPTLIDGEKPKIISKLEQISLKIMDTCQAKTKTFQEFRECAKTRLDRLSNVTVELNAAQLYIEHKYEECVAKKEPKAECKEKSIDMFLDYFKSYMARIKKNEPDPEPFIDYEAFNEMADEEAEEDEGDGDDGDDGDDDEDEDD